MKKILLLISIFIITIFSFNSTYAVEVTVTEKIPWVWCSDNPIKTPCWETWQPICQYKCTLKPWMWWVYDTMSWIIKYFTLLAAMGWVLFIVINWIQLSMWGMDSSVKESAKKRITQTIFGLIILLLSWVILNAIAPWVYK